MDTIEFEGDCVTNHNLVGFERVPCSNGERCEKSGFSGKPGLADFAVLSNFYCEACIRSYQRGQGPNDDYSSEEYVDLCSWKDEEAVNKKLIKSLHCELCRIYSTDRIEGCDLCAKLGGNFEDTLRIVYHSIDNKTEEFYICDKCCASGIAELDERISHITDKRVYLTMKGEYDKSELLYYKLN